MEMDADMMLDKNIRMDDVYFAINEGNYGQSNISCIYSDYNDSKLIFRIRLDKTTKKTSQSENQNGQLDSSDEIYVLKSFQENLLKKTILRGIEKISKVLPRKVPNSVVKEEGKYVRKDTWVLDTTGTNFLEILGLNYIDVPRTYSNDIQEVYNVLGIEAARQAILIEFTEVMDHSDVYLNYHHLSVLCDRMTYNGKDMVAVYRSGILKDNIGPIAKATFEMHTEKILEAARHGHLDNMRGVSSNVMTGQFGYFGTGAFNVLLDLQTAEKTNPNPEDVSYTHYGRTIEKSIHQTKQERKNISCDKDTIFIDNHLSSEMNQNAAATNPATQGDTPCEVEDDDYDMGF